MHEVSVFIIMQEMRIVMVLSSAGIGEKRCFISDVFLLNNRD